jgi:methionine aminotransferase
LREAIATLYGKSYHTQLDAETQVTITAGATEALYSAIAAFTTYGDEVIVFDPSYDSYDPAIRLNGGIPVHLKLSFPGFSIDWDLVDKSITPKTRMIIINTPHNPSGSVLSADDLDTLEKLVFKYNLIVLSDEVYERLIFDKLEHQSMLKRPDLASRSIAVYSFGKTFHATGWKVGYVIAHPQLTAEIRKVHQFNVFSVNTPMQWALSEYMSDPLHYTTISDFYQKKRDLFLRLIQGSSFETLPTHGSYFQLLSFKNSSQKSDVSMAEELTRTFKVASIPISAFYKDRTDNHILRFCFAKKDETLEQAAVILRKI